MPLIGSLPHIWRRAHYWIFVTPFNYRFKLIIENMWLFIKCHFLDNFINFYNRIKHNVLYTDKGDNSYCIAIVGLGFVSSGNIKKSSEIFYFRSYNIIYYFEQLGVNVNLVAFTMILLSALGTEFIHYDLWFLWPNSIMTGSTKQYTVIQSTHSFFHKARRTFHYASSGTHKSFNCFKIHIHFSTHKL